MQCGNDTRLCQNDVGRTLECETKKAHPNQKKKCRHNCIGTTPCFESVRDIFHVDSPSGGHDGGVSIM